ncbi:MAG: lysozyme inhibitor LprI family protein [Bacteroidota bacterium]
MNAQTQMEMNDEAHEAYVKADKELNAVYKLLMSKLNEQEKADVKSVQKKWISRKESSCKKMSDGNGSMSPMILYNCLEEKTLQRTKELRGMLRGR